MGGAIGLALLATLSTERTETLLDDGESTASALTGGYHLAFLIGAALAVVAIVTAVTVLQLRQPDGVPRPRRSTGADGRPIRRKPP